MVEGHCPSIYSGPDIVNMAEVPKSGSFGLGTALLPLSQLEAACPRPQSTTLGAGKPELAPDLRSLLLPSPCSGSSGPML